MKALPVILIMTLPLVLPLRPALGDCGNGKPPKYQVVIGWNGINGFPDPKTHEISNGFFNSSTNTLGQSLGESARKFILAQGGGQTVDGKLIPAPKVDRSLYTGPVEYRDATPKSLQEISKLLNDDVRTLIQKDPNFSPEDYQVLLFVTNHGTLNTGKKGKSYGIGASPGQPGIKMSADGFPQIDEDDIAAFARSLPPGIRFKGIFGQCYGANTLKTLLDHLPKSNARCACGVAAADLDSESYTYGSNSQWEAYVAMQAGFGDGSSSNLMSAISSVYGSTGPGSNMGGATSDHFVMRYLLQHQSELGLKAENGRALLTSSKSVLKRITELERSKGKSISPEDERLLDAIRTSYDQYNRHELQAKAELFRAFLLIADETQKASLRSLLKCEQDPLKPMNPVQALDSMFQAESAQGCSNDPRPPTSPAQDLRRALGF